MTSPDLCDLYLTSGVQGFQTFILTSTRSNNACGTLSSFTYRPPSSPHIPVVHLPPPVLLLLISNRIPAYEVSRSWTPMKVSVVSNICALCSS